MAFRRRLSAAWYAFTRPHMIPSTPGVEFRVVFDGDLIVDADSDLLYYLGKWGLRDGEGWVDLLWDHPVPADKRIFRVEVRPRKVDRP